MRAPLTIVVALSWLTQLTGCGGCDTGGQSPIEYRGGSVNTAGTVYETTDINGEYLHFPAGRVYDLVHGLVTAPYKVTTYVSFDAQLSEDNNIAESAGNQVVIEKVDSSVVRLRNDTCAEFYLRAVAEAEAMSFDPIGN
jgi:hypothetical protein